MAPPTNHVSIFKRMQKGDVSALEFFFREYMEILYYRALGYVKESLVAEDIVQEVFISFWNNRNKIDFSLSVIAYLKRAVENRCKNYLSHVEVQRRYKKELQIQFEEEEEIYDVGKLDELQQRLHIFLEGLPEKCREVFVLACIEGLKYQEVAERLGISLNTVKTQLKGAYQKLRTEFDLNEQELIIALTLSGYIMY